LIRGGWENVLLKAKKLAFLEEASSKDGKVDVISKNII
jgi:hypothetical protein